MAYLFMGTYTPRLDEKGRLILPAKFRDGLEEGLVITKGPEHCLFVWPMAEFLRITEQILPAPFTSKPARDLQRVFFSGASDEALDRQGRITIPPALREYARLTRDCVVIGASSRVEIWDAPSWNAYLQEQEQAFAERSEEVLPGLI